MELKAYNFKFNSKKKLPKITVHGRFQPPLHINHWRYIAPAFKLSNKVTILITNPYQKEEKTNKAIHRSKKENNPFTYKERVKIFKNFFNRIGIAKNKYSFKPFDIRNKKSWNKVLNKNIPNLINTYGSPWSVQKLKDLKKAGFPVIHTSVLKSKPVSGTKIREILRQTMTKKDIKMTLIKAGYMPEAVDGLFKVLKFK